MLSFILTCCVRRYLIKVEHGNIELANRDGKTALHEAALYDRPDAVQVLLENGM
jgi:ankyrin repeat protein